MVGVSKAMINHVLQVLSLGADEKAAIAKGSSSRRFIEKGRKLRKTQTKLRETAVNIRRLEAVDRGVRAAGYFFRKENIAPPYEAAVIHNAHYFLCLLAAKKILVPDPKARKFWTGSIKTALAAYRVDPTLRAEEMFLNLGACFLKFLMALLPEPTVLEEVLHKCLYAAGSLGSQKSSLR